MAESDLDVMAPTREVLRLCDTLKLTCIYPTGEFATSLGLKVFLPGDDHLSRAGHSILGEALARKVILR